MPKKVILFTLQTFSTTGGLQKMTRTLAYSLHQIAKAESWNFKLWSLHDADNDLMPQYLPSENFRGFKNNRSLFISNSLKIGLNPDVIIISHINLALIGLLVKIVNPQCKVWLIAHGIEVWRPFSFLKKVFIRRCDKVLCVSNFTREEIIRWHKLDPDVCTVLNNAIDPFMKLPAVFKKPGHLINRYQLKSDIPIIFTLTRLASTEQYKGHEQVIKAIAKLKVRFPEIRYILAGKYDPLEENRINELISDYGVCEQVILTGFINESELADHFLLADLFVLPSKKEGFGIVFIEALACGLPVICGNSDGSIDAIRKGELGKAIKADDLLELEKTITNSLTTPVTEEQRKYLQSKCLEYFNEGDYRVNLQHLLNNE
jgi:phosphatidylinositol alpha-1,6-mannosyltransferase